MNSTRVLRVQTSRWFIFPLFALVLFASRTSSAQAARTGVGVGAEATTTGIVGGTFVYDAGMFHLDALLGARFESDSSTVAVAGRFFFPVHKSQSADFSIGPGLGVVHTTPHPPPGAPAQSGVNEVHAEGALQIRAFLVPNVALSASAGIGLVFTNGNNRAVIGGQLGGSLGVTYFFF
jgi:hypothetical protein